MAKANHGVATFKTMSTMKQLDFGKTSRVGNGNQTLRNM